MLTIHLLSLCAILLLALSQNKHYQALFKRRVSSKLSTQLKSVAWLLLIAVQYFLIQQQQLGLSYVLWFCWLSIFIVITGLVFSYLGHK